MDDKTRADLEAIFSMDRQVQNQAFLSLLEVTNHPVEWAYQVWDRLVDGLRDKDNHVRAISAQLLCNLAKSDPQGRIFRDFSALLEVTRDARFVTARHCLQSLWKVGVASPKHQEMLVTGLEGRF